MRPAVVMVILVVGAVTMELLRRFLASLLAFASLAHASVFSLLVLSIVQFKCAP